MKKEKIKAIGKVPKLRQEEFEYECDDLSLDNLNGIFTVGAHSSGQLPCSTPTWEDFSGGCNMPYDAIVKERFSEWVDIHFKSKYRKIRMHWYKILYQIFFQK